MGSVVIIFLPILLPLILILGTAEKLGYNALDVLFAPFELALGGIIEVFFGGNEELFMSTFESVVNNFMNFFTENEDTLVSASQKIAELLGSVL